MLNKRYIFSFIILLFSYSFAQCYDFINKATLGIFVGNSTIPGNTNIDFEPEWPSLKIGIALSYPLNNRISFLLESGYANSVKKWQWYSQFNNAKRKQEVNFKQWPIIESSLIVYPYSNNDVLLYVGPGIGFQKNEESSVYDNDPEDASNSEIKYSGLTIHYLIGTDISLISDKASFYFQYKQRIGKCHSKFTEEPGEYSEGSIEKENMSLSGFEIIFGFRYFF